MSVFCAASGTCEQKTRVRACMSRRRRHAHKRLGFHIQYEIPASVQHRRIDASRRRRRINASGNWSHIARHTHTPTDLHNGSAFKLISHECSTLHRDGTVRRATACAPPRLGSPCPTEVVVYAQQPGQHTGCVNMINRCTWLHATVRPTQ